MTSSELAEFVARARKLFRGEMDEDLFALAKNRIANLKLETCMAALNEYGLMHGGARGRFIPAKFFEFYGRVAETRSWDSARAATRKQIEQIVGEGDSERIRIAADWAERRAEVESLGSDLREQIIRSLVARGWQRPPEERDLWPRSWIVAVSDLAVGRMVSVDGGKTYQPADAFYSRLAPPPASLEASAATVPDQASAAMERRSEAPSGSKSALRISPGVILDTDEIPF